MKRLFRLGAALACAAVLAPALATAQTVNWTLGDVDSASHWGPKAAQQFSETVDKATGGSHDEEPGARLGLQDAGQVDAVLRLEIVSIEGRNRRW